MKKVEKPPRSAAEIKIGYERHIDLLDRLSVYFGGEVGYEANFYSGEKNVNTNSQSYSSSEQKFIFEQ